MNFKAPENTVFGLNAVKELLTTRLKDIDKLYFDADRQSSALFELVKECRSLRLSYQMVPTQKLNDLTNRSNHQGIVALVNEKSFVEIEDIHKIIAESDRLPLLVIPASVEDPRNLGAIIRSCVAFGVHALLLERRNTAPLGGGVAKTSAGAVEHIAIAKPRNLEGIVRDFKTAGYSIVGADIKGTATPATTSFCQPTILILGGEDVGIPPYLSKLCDSIVSIPMLPDAQSLNVSVAAGILLYECMRQRTILAP